MLKVGQAVRTDLGGEYQIVKVLPDGYALAESRRHGVRVYIRQTGRTMRRLPGGGYGYRVALHRAIDVGLIDFDDITETLRPEAQPLCGGYAYAD